MKHKILGWFLLLVFQFSNAQTLIVKDADTNEPIDGVYLVQKQLNIHAISNTNGEVSLETFKGLDSIYISHVAYNGIYMSYNDIVNKDFVIKLQASENAISDVVVSVYKNQLKNETSQQIEPLSIKRIDEVGAYSLSDALQVVPGVEILSTGNGISKPVIRGLYGNRVLVLFSGLRFDNQQWQDEHGLGLSTLGVSKAEIIKGPLSVLYGSGAVGGVVNVIEESAPQAGTVSSFAQMQLHSNSRGGALQLGTKANFGKRWFRIALELSNNADYTDGNNNRVLNSRFKTSSLKASYGFTRKKWQSVNHYLFSYNRYGFIFNDLLHFMEEDNRYSRKMTGPHHLVLLNTFSSLNTVQLKHSSLKINGGFQSNMRSEDEGGGDLSLKMHLITFQYSLKWDKTFNETWQMTLAQNSSLAKNSNLGRRKIVPDAWLTEHTLSAYLKQKYNKIVLEYGIGLGYKWIKTTETPTVNSSEKEIKPFKQNRMFFNGLIGLVYMPAKQWNFSLNMASGVRAPNLAELSSNGLHEGTYAYEVGSPNLKNEQNINTEIQLQYLGKQLQISTTGFYNFFKNYIYLKPSDDEWFGFKKYYFVQDKAMLFGTESQITFTPNFVKGLKLSLSYNQVVGKLFNHTFLPYMPAQKISPEIRYDYSTTKYAFYAFANMPIYLKQNRLHYTENPTPQYNLLNMGLGLTVKTPKIDYKLNFIANNLTNKAYFDHLSRIKNYGFLNMGRDFCLQFKIQFNNQLKHKKI